MDMLWSGDEVPAQAGVAGQVETALDAGSIGR